MATPTPSNFRNKLHDTARKLIDPKSLEFKWLMIVISVIAGIVLVLYIVNKYKWDKMNPIFFKGGIDAKRSAIVPAEKISKSTVGNGFTMFFWMYVDNMNYKYGTRKHVFTKGLPEYYSTEKAPGIYMMPDTNDLEIVLSTRENAPGAKAVDVERIYLKDFPIRKWFSVGLVFNNNEAEIYLNGKLYRTSTLLGSVKQNNGNLVIGYNGGFAGKLASICYFPGPKSPTFIRVKHSSGPFSNGLLHKIRQWIRKYIPSISIEVNGESISSIIDHSEASIQREFSDDWNKVKTLTHQGIDAVSNEKDALMARATKLQTGLDN
tara:strand:+ start:2306 stop:3265 length:960 start_codon:yes stop_codon:yes gene_type:complete